MTGNAKMDLVQEAERQLGERLTMRDTAETVRILQNILDGYTVERIPEAIPGDDDLLNIYLDAMRVEGRSEGTLAHYTQALKRMLESAGVPARRVGVQHLRGYLAAEKARGISDTTLENTRQIFSAFFNWLQREGLIDKNPTANLGAIKRMKKQKDVFTDVDMEKLKFACASTRDHAILCFLRSTGCRVSEMTGLDRDDVDLQNMECRVLGKGNKERMVYMDPVTAMLVKKYLDGRRDNDPALFIGERGRMTPSGMRYMLRQTAERAGVEHVHPHKFRRTAATALIRHGMPIQEVACILGHDKLDTTMQYVVLNRTDTANAYRRYAG